MGRDHPYGARTLYGLGRRGEKAGRTGEAEKLWQRALAFQERKLGGDQPYVARTLYGLGRCVDKAGRTEDAEQLWRRALAIQDKLGVDQDEPCATSGGALLRPG